MKSNHLIWVFCGAAGVVHCGGRLDVGETGDRLDAARAAGGTTTSGEAGKSGARAGRGGSGGSGTTGHAGTGNSELGDAGEHGGIMNHGGGGSGSGITAGAGDEAGQNAGQGGSSGSGTGGGAGAAPTPCDCGSTTALTAVACQAGSTYSAYTSDDGKVVLYTSTTYPYPDSNVTASESGLWSVESGTVYTGNRSAEGLSADGQTALFNTASGLTVLRTLAGQDTVVPLSGYRLSADGLTVAGSTDSNAAATWTAAGGVVTPDFGAPAGSSPQIRALSANASVLGGSLLGPTDYTPFVWNATGLHQLGNDTTSGAPGKGFVFTVSTDGSTATGILETGEATTNPLPLYALFRWTETDGLTTLGPCRIADAHGACMDSPFASGDGSVVAASIALDSTSWFSKAFRWTQADGLVDIAPNDYAFARGMSADGAVVAGAVADIDTGNPSAPFVWTAAQGKQDLAERLASAGADLSGWTLDDVSALSSDGTVVVGTGTCHGVPALYRAHLTR